MLLQRDRRVLLERFYARDSRHDGQFVVGVVTTGIYCLPSCPARNPRDENVVHFAQPAEAREAGLRPCRRCRPDDFHRNRDPDLERLLALLAAVADAPGSFADTASLAAWAGFGTTKLTSLCRAHFQATPGPLLVRARIDHACRALLGTDRRVLDVGLDAGFESSSAFHDNFRRQTGLAPGDYRRLRNGTRFVLALPEDFRSQQTLAYLTRDPESVCEKRQGRTIEPGSVRPTARGPCAGPSP